jgi:hypothetical protein
VTVRTVDVATELQLLALLRGRSGA